MINSSRAAGGRANGDGTNKARTRDRPRGVPAPEANAELQVNIDVCSMNLFPVPNYLHLF
jgi:cyclin-dependent kinase 12/13